MAVTPPSPDLVTELSSDVAAATAEKQIAGRSPWQLARARLRRDRVSMIAAYIVGITVLVALASPLMKKLGWIKPYEINQELVQGIGSVPTGKFGGISTDHWLGVVPGTGWDLLSRLIAGVSLSLFIATAATILSIGIGTIAGLVSGYLGNWSDFWISRFIDLVLAFPQLLMLLALSPVLLDLLAGGKVPGNKQRVLYLILVFGFFGWPYFARIIRGQVLSLREREFIEAARSIGASKARIYFKELLPNLWAPILIYFTLNLAQNVGAEAALSFLGVGVQSPTPTLGTLLSDSSLYSTSDPTFFFIPGTAIVTIIMSLNLLGDGLRDALDPKSSR